jgi:Tol biopolymer transport system component
MVGRRRRKEVSGRRGARIRGLLAACAVLGVLAVALLGATAANASYPGENGMIAWASRGLQAEVGYGIVAYSILVARPDGSGVHPITVNDGTTGRQDISATWSPDGNRLAIWTCADALFGCNRANGVDIINWDGSGRRQLVPNAKMPTWSPDGGQIAYVGDPDLPDFSVWRSLYVVNADGTGKTRIPVGAQGDCAYDGVWWTRTAAGPRIAYKVVCQSTGPGYQLRSANPDGTEQSTLIGSFSGDLGRIDWSPDGTKLVFDMGFGFVADLYEHTVATAQTRNITNTPRIDPLGYGTESGAAYSPTGTRLIWEGDPRGTNLYKDLYVGTAEASGATPITDNSWDDALPSWQPCINGVTISCSPPVDPDADEDGVPDAIDNCPAQPGPPTNGGCPLQTPTDTDGDGVPDAIDTCPIQSGLPYNAGCPAGTAPPDGDGDGVPDATDACPSQPGQQGNAGCPAGASPSDRDGDGVPDAADACPETAGPLSAYGCPAATPPGPTPPEPQDVMTGDLGVTCGTSRIQQLDLNADIDTYRLAAPGAQSCFFLVSNRAANALLDFAAGHEGDVASAFFTTLGVPWVKSFVQDAVERKLVDAEIAAARKKLIDSGLKLLAAIAPNVGAAAQLAYGVDNWILRGGKALTALGMYALYKQVRDDGACVAFEVYRAAGSDAPRFDYDLLLSPHHAASIDADPTVWEHDGDGMHERLLNLHCDPETGDVTRVVARDTNRVLQGGWGTLIVDGGDQPGNATGPSVEVTGQPDGTALIAMVPPRSGTLTAQLQVPVGGGAAAHAARRTYRNTGRRRVKAMRGRRVLLRLAPHGAVKRRVAGGHTVDGRVRVTLKGGGKRTVKTYNVKLHDACAHASRMAQAACRAQVAGKPPPH